jgi:hypothetical protein
VTLFHGSNIGIIDIDLEKCRPYKDFGKGFYLTDIKVQAEKMAIRVSKLYGGSPFVSAFELNEDIYNDKKLSILCFEKPIREWALFVVNNRNRNFINISEKLCNQDNKYAMVKGPVANDDIAYLFRTFSSGLIDIDVLVRDLEYKTLTSQYSFHTDESLKYLRSLGVC